MGHSIGVCPQCDGWVMEGSSCDNCFNPYLGWQLKCKKEQRDYLAKVVAKGDNINDSLWLRKQQLEKLNDEISNIELDLAKSKLVC